jgi:hypothetical protein
MTSDDRLSVAHPLSQHQLCYLGLYESENTLLRTLEPGSAGATVLCSVDRSRVGRNQVIDDNCE